MNNNIRIALYIGLITGIIHGSADILIRLFVWSFEWFELYQTLLLSSLVFSLAFFILSLAAEIIKKFVKKDISKETCIVFYSSVSIASLLLFYSGTIINRDLLPKLTFFDTLSIAINILLFSVIAIIFIILLTKGRKTLLKIINLLLGNRAKAIANNAIFMVAVFIIVSLALDAYLRAYIPNPKLNPEMEQYPNIILITLDAVRADHISLYGYERNTSPNLDRLSENSIIFENAIAPAVWTNLVVGSILTGKYLSNYDPEHTNKGLRQEDTTLAEILRRKGYNTAGFITAPGIKGKFGFSQGFLKYEDRFDFFEHNFWSYDQFSLKGAIDKLLPIPALDFEGLRNIEDTNKKIFRWLEKNHKSAFFAYIHYIDPHVPYTPTMEFRKKFTNDTRSYEELENEYEKTTKRERYGYVPEDVVRTLIDLYDAEIQYTDYHMEKLFRKLDELGIKNNTIIIITADHAEEFYDQGYFRHGRTLYQSDVHVPFILYYPEGFKGKRVEETISTIDILPTVLDILNIEIPGDIDGLSLLPLINEGNYEREYVKSEIFGFPGHEIKKQVAIYHGDWKLLEVEPETEAIPSGLYNLRTDPNEKKNLYDVFIEKRKQLQAYITK